MGQRERTGKRTVRAFDPVVIVAVVCLFEASLTAECNDVVFDAQFEIVTIHSRKFRFQDYLIFVLVDVYVRVPGAAANAFVTERRTQVV